MPEHRAGDIARRLIELTRDLVLFPSTASRPEERERCFQFIKNHVETIDHLEVREHRSRGFPSLVALPPGVPRPEALLCAHLDVVDQPDPASYRPTLREGRIHGAGAGDMKGQLAVLLEVLRELHGETAGLPLGIAITSDEEVGGDHGIRSLLDDAGLRCGVAIIPDGGSLHEITIEEKGTVRLELIWRGSAGHGARPWLVENPLEKLIDRLGAVVRYFGELATRDRWHPTCAVTIVRTPNETANRIPEEAGATIDVRFPPPWSVDRALHEVRRLAGSEAEIRPLLLAEPTVLSPDPLFLEVVEEVTGRPARLVREAGGSDARFFCRHGIPVIMCRPLVGDIHGPDEWIDVESMVTLYRIYGRYLRRKLSGGPPQ